MVIQLSLPFGGQEPHDLFRALDEGGAVAPDTVRRVAFGDGDWVAAVPHGLGEFDFFVGGGGGEWGLEGRHRGLLFSFQQAKGLRCCLIWGWVVDGADDDETYYVDIGLSFLLDVWALSGCLSIASTTSSVLMLTTFPPC